MHTHDQDQLTAPPAQTSRPHESADRAPGTGSEIGPLNADGMLHLQRTAGNSAVAGLVGEAGAGGAPLDTDTRSFMESRLGADFSDVRVHTDASATESARSFGAQAYTVGSDVVVQADRWAPDTDAGRHLLAHELTHVVQQKAGPVDGTPTGDGVALSDPGDRFEQEAERSADAAVGRDVTSS